MSLSLSLYLFLSIFFGHVMSSHHSEQMSQRSQVSIYFFGISSFLSNTSSSTLSSVSTTSSFLSSPSPPPLGLKYRDSPIEQKAICWLNVEMGWTVRVASQVPVHLNNQDPSQQKILTTSQNSNCTILFACNLVGDTDEYNCINSC